MKLILSNSILQKIPTFKVGVAIYKNIVIDESPKMLKGRLEFFQEKIRTDLEVQTTNDYPGILEWQKAFKQAGIDPIRYRPSHEALFRRIGKGNSLPFIHSAADLNNFFSMEYETPVGIYDLETICDYIKFSIGKEADVFKELNGRVIKMKGKIVSSDSIGVFGSPIVDSARTKTKTTTTDAVQLFYLKPSMKIEEGQQLLQAATKMFLQLHSGDAITCILSRHKPEYDMD